MAKSTNRTIAKNTIFLYFRMMATMLISLYTSRVVLQVLGISDYGLYAVVGGVVGMLSFINGALGVSTSRFLSFELGSGNAEQPGKTFSTLLNGHIILAAAVVVLAETIGLWFVYNKLGIPAERMKAAVWVYHISIITTAVSMTQIPYTAAIISREKMNVYAYTSIVEVALKLGVVYILKIIAYDKLVSYAVLIGAVSVGMALFYRFYCISRFPETRYRLILDKGVLRSVGGFSGWSLFGQISIAFNSQGMNIITNMFFGPTVVAARVISVQVNMAAMQFVSNFRIAATPQVVKKYAAGDHDGSKQLLLESTKLSFYLMLLLGLPIILLAEPLLQLWLGQAPDYAGIFLQLIIVQSLLTVFDQSFLVPLQAKGRLMENALTSPVVGIIKFWVVYLLFKSGSSPVALSYAGIVSMALISLVIKPFIVCKIVDYTFRDILSVFVPCLKVCVLGVPIPILASHYLDSGIVGSALVLFISVTCVLVAVYFFGISADMRGKALALARRKFSA